jgi:flagella synthesis protein FlgN
VSKREQLLAIVDEDLGRDLADYQCMVTLMTELHQHLARRDVGRVDAINVHLSSLIVNVGQRAERRSKILVAFRLGVDGCGILRLFDCFAPARRSQLQEVWFALGECAGQCRRLNENNGRLLSMQGEILGRVLGRSNEHIYTPSLI